MSERQSKGVHEQKKKGGIIALVVAGTVVIIAIIVTLVFILGKDSGQPDEPSQPGESISVPKTGGEGTIVSDSYEEPESESNVGLGYYEAKMSGTTWYFDFETLTSDGVYITNAEENIYDMYFDLVEEDSGDILYTSPVLKIGDDLENLTLDANLERGTYTCVMSHHLLDPSTNQEVDGLELYVDIVIF